MRIGLLAKSLSFALLMLFLTSYFIEDCFSYISILDTSVQKILFVILFTSIFYLISKLIFYQKLKFFNQINVAVIVIDKNGKILFYNQETENILEKLKKWLEINPEKLKYFNYFDFYADSTAQKEFYNDSMNVPFTKDLDIGSEIIEVSVSFLNGNKRGKYYLIHWEIVTRIRNQARWEIVVTEQLENTTGQLSKESNELKILSEEVLKTASETETQAKNGADFASEVSRNINQLTENVSRTSERTQKIAKNIENSSGISREALSESFKTAQIIMELSNVGKQIAKMAKNIESVMQQTKILGINANIEAAKAGAAGKGFSVIASEVGVLADETAHISNDINRLIKEILEKIPHSVQSIENIQYIIKKLNDLTSEIIDLMGEQKTVMDHMQEDMGKADQNTNEISNKMQEIVTQNQISRENISQEMESAERVNQIAAIFRIICNRFNSERIVTPNDIYRMILIIENMLNVLLKKKLNSEQFYEISKIDKKIFHDKQPADVLKSSIDFTKNILSFFHLPAKKISFPKGIVTPTQTYNFIEDVVKLLEELLRKENCPNIGELKKQPPFENMTPNDVYTLTFHIRQRMERVKNFRK